MPTLVMSSTQRSNGQRPMAQVGPVASSSDQTGGGFYYLPPGSSSGRNFPEPENQPFNHFHTWESNHLASFPLNQVERDPVWGPFHQVFEPSGYRQRRLPVLKSLESLDLSDCKSIEEFPDLSNLKKLVQLKICGWHDLTEIRGLEELKSLELLDITSCSSIEQLPDLSNHINLCHINANYCEKLTEIWGIEELKSLKYMAIRGCKSVNLPNTGRWRRWIEQGMELDLDVLHKMSTDFVSKGLTFGMTRAGYDYRKPLMFVNRSSPWTKD
ncbi:hypothetical protein LguiB_006185 [Lonicera macranthoides]